MRLRLLSYLVIALAILPVAAAGQEATTEIPDMSEFLMNEAKEIGLARSAAPDEVSSKASVLVLKETGYERVVDGTNGIVCYVVRSWGRPTYFEDDEVYYRPAYIVPECLDPNATRVIMPLQRFRTELAIKRTPAVEMNRLVHEAYQTGRLHRTETVSFSYMLSNEMQFNTNAKGTPHIMVYLPDEYNNETLGIESLRGDGFFIEGGPDEPYTAAVIYREGYDPIYDGNGD